ncbi:response regulator [Isoalcanivorax pacificus W11-5]|uniref:Response regulator n=1 Tax=Isoalcanivorax pacificus W11-5 TaxID=391936 RepID=A0A0B4XMY3_9GAMM|nr:diguanylate cyclase [Isoalcanivorax pacificus]AJD48040.1 response regulator [Isoalcanivorax pacificus W11-5]
MTQLPGRPGGKPRLLMVDDSRVMRTAATKMLGERFDVVVAENGVQGWQAIRSDQSIQVVFTDLSMPELDGYGLLEKIRTCDDPGIAGLPVIVVTGAENDEAAREKALQLGATDFITKPFNSTDLTARASAHADYQRERRTLEAATTIDRLTGLGNAEFYLGRLKQDLAFAARHAHALSVVRIEVDHFNKLFIRVGKSAADSMLVQVAKLISRLIRKEDTAARTGVAQFSITLPTADAAGAKVFADRLCRQVREVNLQHEGRRLPLSISAGVLSPAPHPGQTARTVMEETALVLQGAVRAGGNQVMTEGGLRNALPGQPQQPARQPFSPPPISVEQALAMLASGRDEEVRRHLPSLRKQLAPLLKILDSEGH